MDLTFIDTDWRCVAVPGLAYPPPGSVTDFTQICRYEIDFYPFSLKNCLPSCKLCLPLVVELEDN